MATKGRIKTQQRIEIANTGQGTQTQGYYRYTLFNKSNKIMKTGTIGPFPRKELLACDLLLLCLIDARGQRVLKKVK